MHDLRRPDGPADGAGRRLRSNHSGAGPAGNSGGYDAASTPLGELLDGGRENLDLAVAALNATHPGRALACPGDVSSYDEIAQAVRRTAQRFGALHLAVNDAGVAGQASRLHETGPGII